MTMDIIGSENSNSFERRCGEGVRVVVIRKVLDWGAGIKI